MAQTFDCKIMERSFDGPGKTIGHGKIETESLTILSCISAAVGNDIVVQYKDNFKQPHCRILRVTAIRPHNGMKKFELKQV